MRFSGLAIVNESTTFVSSKFHDTIHQGCFSERHQQCSLSALACFLWKKAARRNENIIVPSSSKETSSTTVLSSVFRTGHSEVKKAIASCNGEMESTNGQACSLVMFDGMAPNLQEKKKKKKHKEGQKKSFPAVNCLKFILAYFRTKRQKMSFGVVSNVESVQKLFFSTTCFVTPGSARVFNETQWSHPTWGGHPGGDGA